MAGIAGPEYPELVGVASNLNPGPEGCHAREGLPHEDDLLGLFPWHAAGGGGGIDPERVLPRVGRAAFQPHIRRPFEIARPKDLPAAVGGLTYLKYFTWLDQTRIAELEHLLFEQPERREAQRTLARELTRMVHGETALARAEQASQALFGGDIAGLDAADIEDIFAEVPSSELAKDALSEGVAVVDLLVSSGLASSKADARRAIQGGGIYLNNERVGDAAQTAGTPQAIDGRFLVLRKGRRQYHLIRVM